MPQGAAQVVVDLALACAVFLLPAMSGLLVAVSLGIESRVAQCIYALATPCAAAYLASGFYLITPSAGQWAEVIAYASLVAAGMVVGVRRPGPSLAALRWWAWPAVMVAGAAGVGLGLGFLHGGTQFPLKLEEIRYIHRLANDNVLPRAFARQLLATQRPLDHYVSAPWLSSDRPPMETSVYLMFRAVVPMADPNALIFQAVGTLLQSFWAVAFWLLLRAGGLRRSAMVIGLAAVTLSGFVVFNSFYVWPKLFAGSFVALLTALVLGTDWDEVRAKIPVAVACGLAGGVGMLGHEGSALGLVPLAVVALWRRARRPRLGGALAVLGTGVALLIPWFLYQQFYDPPGNDLTKLQLAGPGWQYTNQSLISSVMHAYGRLGISRLVSFKWSNLNTPFIHEGAQMTWLARLVLHLVASSGPSLSARDAAVQQLRDLSYEYLLPTLGLLVLGLPAYAWVRTRSSIRQRADSSTSDRSFLDRLWVFMVVAIVFWALVLFGPSATNNEQGSYGVVLVAFAACFISLWRLSPRLATLLGSLQVLLGVVVYALFDPLHPYMVPAPTAADPGEIALACAGFAMLMSGAWCAAREAREAAFDPPLPGTVSPE